MPELEIRLKAIEQKWFLPLYSHCKKLFSGVYLPSHDNRHHFRVWFFARDLLSLLECSSVPISNDFIEQLIVAVFFHDTGLTAVLDESHGDEGEKLCLEFFNNRRLSRPEGFERILEAIRLHDNKDYQVTREISPDSSPGLLQILSICDDLDAYGYLGIYRYAEIYLMRGTDKKVLAGKVLLNLEKRFRFASRTLGFLPSLIKQHTRRYEITRNFYLSCGQDPEKLELMESISNSISEKMDFLSARETGSNRYHHGIISEMKIYKYPQNSPI